MRFFIGVCNNEHCYLHSFLFYFFAHLEALQYTHGSEIHCMYVTSIMNLQDIQELSDLTIYSVQ